MGKVSSAYHCRKKKKDRRVRATLKKVVLYLYSRRNHSVSFKPFSMEEETAACELPITGEGGRGGKKDFDLTGDWWGTWPILLSVARRKKSVHLREREEGEGTFLRGGSSLGKRK